MLNKISQNNQSYMVVFQYVYTYVCTKCRHYIYLWQICYLHVDLQISYPQNIECLLIAGYEQEILLTLLDGMVSWCLPKRSLFPFLLIGQTMTSQGRHQLTTPSNKVNKISCSYSTISIYKKPHCAVCRCEGTSHHVRTGIEN